MFECLVITEVVVQRLLECRHRRQEAIVRGTPPQDFPEPLEHLQLRTVTGEGIPLQMVVGVQDLVDQDPSMPGGRIDYDHPPREGEGRVRPSHITPMRRKAHVEMALFGDCWSLALSRPHDHTRGQPATDQIQGAKDGERVVTSEVADQRPVAFDAPGSAQRWAHGKAGCILAQQHELPGLRFFFKAARAWRAVSCWSGSPVREREVGREGRTPCLVQNARRALSLTAKPWVR